MRKNVFTITHHYRKRIKQKEEEVKKNVKQKVEKNMKIDNF
jgi:hypothetical protein